MKPVLFDYMKLHEYCVKNKVQPFKEKQVTYEIFKNQNVSLDEMTTLSKDMKADLEKEFQVLSLTQDSIKEDSQTTKFGFKTHDWHIIETVVIYHWKPEEYKTEDNDLNRITICISSQVGCPVKCLFCVTWQAGVQRNLTRDEIISQILYANNYIKKKLWKKSDWTLNWVRNVVFMWMGEPLLNYDNMKKSLEFMLDQDKLSLSKRHITISTSWIIAWIQRLIDDEVTVKLAISLHAPDQALREKLIPIAKHNKLNDLMNVIRKYVKATDNRIFYEYIMIDNMTDTPEMAKKLADLLRGELAHVNLIPYNENPAIAIKESSPKNIQIFKKILENNWVTVTTRDSMGRSIKSACGQLGYEKLKKMEDWNMEKLKN